MLIYEKITNGVRTFYGTKGNVPSKDDKELIFKDAEGNIITLTKNDSYFDDGHGGIKRKSDGKAVNVFIDGMEEAVIPIGLIIKAETNNAINDEEDSTEESVEETKGE